MSNPYALCAFEDIRLYYGIPEDKMTDDTADLIDALIDRESTMIESYCDRQFISRDYTEYMDGKNQRRLFPSQYPITSVSGIWVDSDWNWTDSHLVDSSDYRIVDQTHIIYNSSFTAGEQNIKIAYTAGLSSIPADLKQACVLEVCRTLRDKTDKNFNIIQKTMNDGSVIYETKLFLPQSQAILDKYKRKWAY